MQDNGYVYVLINPSMEGLVKIGKTERDPKERAQELSSVTGVPTPFVVAYKDYFSNCNKVEKFLHNKLQNKGYRISNNREFFNAPLAVVINFLIQAKKIFKSDRNSSNDFEPNKKLNGNQDNNTNSNNKSLLDLADHYYYDSGQDQKAFKLYKQALDKGLHDAYYNLGHMMIHGEGCLKDDKKALEYLKKGAKKGDGRCCMELAYYYEDLSMSTYKSRNKKTSARWFEKFLASDLSSYTNYSEALYIFHYLVRRYMVDGADDINKLISKNKNNISVLKRKILNYYIDLNESNRKNGEMKMEHVYLNVAKSIKKYS